jgi:histidyl-tRNA synthetase
MSEANDRLEPQTLKGFQDFLPEDVLARKAVVECIEKVVRKYGFAPIETPALEHLATLLGTGGEETNKELFRSQTPEQEPIALRFDLTVPFARLLAQYPHKLKVPFRRYAVGPVWRADKPGPGRLREFTQFDIDVAGAASVTADAEIVAVMCEVMTAVGIERYTVAINNRKLIDALLDHCDIHEESRQKHVLRVIDKLQKVGLENTRLELGPGRVDESGDPIRGVHLEEAVIDRILQFIGISGGSRSEILDQLQAALPDTEPAKKALAEMGELDAALTALGVSENCVKFEPSLARGLDYYTGPVFETLLVDVPELGSVMGGGRYDGLVARFSARPIPCTGMSVGLDRLMAALTRLDLIPQPKSLVQVLVVTLSQVPKAEALKVASELRAAHIHTETYFGEKAGFAHQLSHANHYNIPLAVILGEDELSKGLVSIKDLEAGKRQRESIQDRETYRKAGTTGQITVPRGELVATVSALLKG